MLARRLSSVCSATPAGGHVGEARCLDRRSSSLRRRMWRFSFQWMRQRAVGVHRQSHDLQRVRRAHLRGAGLHMPWARVCGGLRPHRHEARLQWPWYRPHRECEFDRHPRLLRDLHLFPAIRGITGLWRDPGPWNQREGILHRSVPGGLQFQGLWCPGPSGAGAHLSQTFRWCTSVSELPDRRGLLVQYDWNVGETGGWGVNDQVGVGVNDQEPYRNEGRGGEGRE
jgi:hypothetical protein